MLSADKLIFKIDSQSILNQVSFNVISGETVGLIGPNGSGKTTLFNCISGFNRIGSGSLVFEETDITYAAPYDRAKRGLGRVFQNYGVFRDMTVLENMIAGLEGRQSLWANFFPWQSQNQVNRDKAMEFLKEVKLEGKATQKAGSLSGGQMRLLEIIRTLAFGAKLFLLDEPTAGVSPRMKEDVAQLIQRLQSMGKTILIIEHDINFIQKFCKRILVLDQGRVVLDDTPENVRSNRLLQDIYFGTQN